MEKRAAAFARLFEAVHEGVYIGTFGPDVTSTIAANPHLKLIFGYPVEIAESEVRPFDPDRFVDTRRINQDLHLLRQLVELYMERDLGLPRR